MTKTDCDGVDTQPKTIEYKGFQIRLQYHFQESVRGWEYCIHRPIELFSISCGICGLEWHGYPFDYAVQEAKQRIDRWLTQAIHLRQKEIELLKKIQKG